MVSLVESVSPQPDPHHLRSCTKSVSHQYENEGKNDDIREGDGYSNQNKTTYIIELFHVQ